MKYFIPLILLFIIAWFLPNFANAQQRNNCYTFTEEKMNEQLEKIGGRIVFFGYGRNEKMYVLYLFTNNPKNTWQWATYDPSDRENIKLCILNSGKFERFTPDSISPKSIKPSQ